MRQVVVMNISNQDLKIPELRQILPAGTIDQKFILPLDVAIRYKRFLHPVMVFDDAVYQNNVEAEIPFEEALPAEEMIKQIAKKKKEEVSTQAQKKILKGKKITPGKCPKKKVVLENKVKKNEPIIPERIEIEQPDYSNIIVDDDLDIPTVIDIEDE